ncbi:MAG: RdgB/HAM1 family non-canonical purine NTP pyrophosphatase [bacterium]
MKKILIATSNQGKFKEITSEMSDMPFDFISLQDLPKKIKEPVEDQPTIEENAILKAKYYAKKTGLPSLADDCGLFIDALNGWPGVISARIGTNDDERRANVLSKMNGKTNRKAKFKAVLALFDPNDQNMYLSYGECQGQLLEKENLQGKNGFGYDPIFYVTEKGKTYSEMPIVEKNLISHRGRALANIKFYLIKQYSFKQYIVPLGILVKDRKMLMTKRRDHRLEYNNKWEFPGGGVDNGESIKDNLLREVREETGYSVDVVEQLPEILTETRKKYDYQVFLLPYICKIKSGKLKTSDNETYGHGWFTMAEALKKSLLPLNKKCIQDKNNWAMLKKYID